MIQTRAALEVRDFTRLDVCLSEHAALMQALQALGLSTDITLTELVQTLQDTVAALLNEAVQVRAEIAQAWQALAQKKKQLNAYGKAALLSDGP
jgi:hypothetical protein